MVVKSADANASLEREREYFDQLVEQQGDFNPFTQDGWNTLQSQLNRSINPRALLRILDIGCGTGQSRQIYIANASYYLGVDLSAQSIMAAQAKFPESEWQVGDARNLSLPSESFDLVAYRLYRGSQGSSQSASSWWNGFCIRSQFVTSGHGFAQASKKPVLLVSRGES